MYIRFQRRDLHNEYNTTNLLCFLLVTLFWWRCASGLIWFYLWSILKQPGWTKAAQLKRKLHKFFSDWKEKDTHKSSLTPLWCILFICVLNLNEAHFIMVPPAWWRLHSQTHNKGLSSLSSLIWLMSVIVSADNTLAWSMLLPLRSSFDSLSAN